MQEPNWRGLTVGLRLKAAHKCSDFLFQQSPDCLVLWIWKVPEIWGSIQGKLWPLKDLAG